MPNVFSAPRRLAVRLIPRVLLVTKHNRCTLAASAIHAGAAHASSTNNHRDLAVATASTLVTGAMSGAGLVRPHAPNVKSAAKETAKDVLLLSLEALVQSADAFPPLKSAVGGLLFLTAQVEMVSSNEEQISDIYAQIDAFAESLVRAVPDATTLSPAHEAALEVLAKEMSAVCVDLEAMVRQRRILRFLRAKRHSAQLGRLMMKLDKANGSFTRTMLSRVEIKTSEILVSVQRLRDEVHRLTRMGGYFFFDIAFTLDRSQ